MPNLIVQQFREEYAKTQVIHNNTFWLGRKALKNPFDAWIYQELIFKVWPDIIIETGTHEGGGSLFLASICDLINKGRIITIENSSLPNSPLIHPRITLLKGSSTEVDLGEIQGKVMVILDSDHSYEHVSKELKRFAPLVSKGSYLIIEDTHMPFTRRAVEDFLKENGDFFIDTDCEKFLFTHNPAGYLKKNNE